MAGQGTGSVATSPGETKVYVAVGGVLCAEWGEARRAVCSLYHLVLSFDCGKGRVRGTVTGILSGEK